MNINKYMLVMVKTRFEWDSNYQYVVVYYDRNKLIIERSDQCELQDFLIAITNNEYMKLENEECHCSEENYVSHQDGVLHVIWSMYAFDGILIDLEFDNIDMQSVKSTLDDMGYSSDSDY